MEFGSEEVAKYLRENPKFFDEYADMLADIFVSHPHGGRAISISERQIVTLRDKNHILQEKLRELIKYGKENDVIGEKMHRLAVILLTYTHLGNSLNGLYFNLREDFAVPHTVLRLWNLPSSVPDLPEFTPTSDDIHIIAESLMHPYCGPHVVDEIKQWFGDDTSHLRSFAMVPLRSEQTVGIMVLASEDPQRFYPEMGTIHLKRLGDLVGTAIAHIE